MVKYSNKERKISRTTTRSHNSEGHYQVNEEFRKTYGRYPTSDERREFHKRLTKSHSLGLDSVLEEPKPANPVKELLLANPKVLHISHGFYCGGSSPRKVMGNIPLKTLANIQFESAESSLGDRYNPDKPPIKLQEFEIQNHQLVQRIYLEEMPDSNTDEVRRSEITFPLMRLPDNN